MKDWLGNDLQVGDTVIYPAASGRSITMVVGEITGFGERDTGWDEAKTEPTIKIRPLRSSRWRQHRGTNYYVDNRTGKRIDPYRRAADGTFPHVADGGYYRDAAGNRHERQVYRGNDHLFEYVPTVFADHVEKRHDGPKPVTIGVTENVTKWTGTLPPAPASEPGD